MVLMALFLSTQTSAAADKNADANKRLSADEIQQIQTIGQTVLTAKKNGEADPDVQVLKQRISVLHKAVSELAGPNGQAGSTHISLKTNETTTNDSAHEEAGRLKRENKVRNALNEVRRHRSLLQAANEHDTPEHASMKHAAAAKAEELENAVEDALNSRPDEKAEKIAKLKDRLAVKSLSQAVQQPDTGEKTPTISTIVRHREQ
jgi:hypothetical protein